MTTPAVIDIEPLLVPISADAPAGADIRGDSSPASVYYRIKDARAAARAAERGNIDEASGLADGWETVVDTGIEILTGKSKDIEIAAWMTEALVRLHGFAGLREGFKLINGLVAAFWDQLFPMPDEEGVATLLAAVTGLNGEGADGTLVFPIRKIEVTAADPPYAFWQFEQATELEKVTDAAKKKIRVDAGDVSMDQFTASVKQTPAAFFGALMADITEAQQAFVAMNATLAAKAGADSPPTAKIRDMMEAIASCLRFTAGDKLAAVAQSDAAPADAAPAGAPDEASTGGAPAAAAKKTNGAYTRDQAFADLSRIAEFFRKTEPHSPISYTIDDLVRRGKLSLPELLAELITDANQRRAFMVAAGIKPND